MASLPMKRYRFSVLSSDLNTQAWMAAQQNVNVSIRMLIQAAQEQFGTADIISQCKLDLNLDKVTQKIVTSIPKKQELTSKTDENTSALLESMLK